MCGACGRDRSGWLTGYLSSSYVREVVAARLSRLGRNSMITAHPSGWSWSNRGRPRFFATIVGLVDELVNGLGQPDDLVGWIVGLRPHRPCLVPRDSVPERHRRPARGRADLLAGSDPRTSINRLLGLLLVQRTEPGREMITELVDDQGRWTFVLPSEQHRSSATAGIVTNRQ